MQPDSFRLGQNAKFNYNLMGHFVYYGSETRMCLSKVEATIKFRIKEPEILRFFLNYEFSFKNRTCK